MLDTARGPLRGRLLLPVGAVGCCFSPNAPYIITDLFHLEPRAGVPLWYDLALIFSSAWNGLMLAYASLLTMQTLVRRRFGTLSGWAFVSTALLLSSFGIYLGRYLRFNSWDVLTNPLTLFYDILNQFLNPTHHLRTWGITVVFGLVFAAGLRHRAAAGAGAGRVSREAICRHAPYFRASPDSWAASFCPLA